MVRMADTEPGEMAEADFVRLGMINDPATGKRRVVRALIIVLSYSRHCFVWPTHSQKLEDVIAGLEETWAFFAACLAIWSLTISPPQWPDRTRCILA